MRRAAYILFSLMVIAFAGCSKDKQSKIEGEVDSPPLVIHTQWKQSVRFSSL